MNTNKTALDIDKNSVILSLLIISTWLLYPWAISWIFPVGIRVIVLILLCLSACLLILKPYKKNQYQLKITLTLIAYLYVSYILILTIGYFTFHSNTNLWMLISHFVKLLFLLYLLKITTVQSIKLLFNIYSSLTVLLTLLGLLNTLGIYYDWFYNHPLLITQGLDFNRIINVNFGGYFDSIMPQIGFYRLQSFAIEPAAYAMAASVALYWLILFQKSFYRALIVACGIAASWSLGVVLGMFIILILLLFNKIIGKTEKFKLIFIFLLCLVPQLVVSSLTSSTINSEFTQNKKDSLALRIEETKDVIDYLIKNPAGAGFGGAKKLLENPISVGYINAMADSGIIGGVLYIFCFILLGILATLVILGFYNRKIIADSDESKILVTMATILFMILFMGLQREPPDSSYWHFWIIASFIYMYSLSGLQVKNDSSS